MVCRVLRRLDVLRAGCVWLAWALIFLKAVVIRGTRPGLPEDEEPESVQSQLCQPT